MKNAAPSAKRIVECQIDGVTYWMNYSLYAMRELDRKAAERGQTLNQFLNDDVLGNIADNTAYTAVLLIQQGARYKEAKEGVKAPTITAEDLMLICSEAELAELAEYCAAAILAGRQREIQSDPPPEGKNAETAQSQ